LTIDCAEQLRTNPPFQARVSRFLSDDLDVSVTIVPWQPIWFCAGRPQGGLAT
jgi:hypothetical protein